MEPTFTDLIDQFTQTISKITGTEVYFEFNSDGELTVVIENK